MPRRPLPSRASHHESVVSAAARAGLLLVGVLLVGTIGLLVTNRGNLDAAPDPAWVNALFGAAMIMTGMGPAPDVALSVPAKLFLAGYSVVSGVGFLGVMGVLFQPVFHRFLHRFHLELDDDPSSTG